MTKVEQIRNLLQREGCKVLLEVGPGESAEPPLGQQTRGHLFRLDQDHAVKVLGNKACVIRYGKNGEVTMSPLHSSHTGLIVDLGRLGYKVRP